VVTQWFRITQMSSRHGVRAISACVSDVPGVRTVEASLDTRTLSVTGTADATAVQTAIGRAGYQAVILSDRPEPDGTAGRTAGATEVER
jgi:copper chaperone CopZ